MNDNRIMLAASFDHNGVLQWQWYIEETSRNVIAYGTDFHATPAEAWVDCMEHAAEHLIP